MESSCTAIQSDIRSPDVDTTPIMLAIVVISECATLVSSIRGATRVHQSDHLG
jgi:hypothetical protein